MVRKVGFELFYQTLSLVDSAALPAAAPSKLALEAGFGLHLDYKSKLRGHRLAIAESTSKIAEKLVCWFSLKWREGALR